MAWTLQPKSWYQAIRPNWYNIAYRRTGAYKGMGWLGQEPVSTDVLANLPLVGPYTSNPLYASAVTQPAIPVSQIPVQAAAITPQWVIYGGLIIVALMVFGGVVSERRR